MKRIFTRTATRGAGSVGVALSGSQMCLAHIERDSQGRPRLADFTTTETDAGSLRRTLREWGIEGADCYAALSADEYKLALTEALGVEDQELRAAMRWKAKELFDRMMEEAVLDVFRVPEGGFLGRQASVFVVASTMRVVNDHRDRVLVAGGHLVAIDIADLALRNLIQLTPANAEGAALLYLEANFSVVMIYREGQLYLSRRIPIGQTDLRSAAANNSLSDIFTRLVPEVQRTLDYYERHYGSKPVARLYLAPPNRETVSLLDALSSSIGVPVEILDISQLLPCPAGFEAGRQSGTLLAIGAALRQSAELAEEGASA